MVKIRNSVMLGKSISSSCFSPLIYQHLLSHSAGATSVRLLWEQGCETCPSCLRISYLNDPIMPQLEIGAHSAGPPQALHCCVDW